MHIIKKMKGIIICCFVLCIINSISVTASSENSFEQEKSNDPVLDGWIKAESGTYSYKNRKKQTGWCKIKQKYYYFDKKGILQKNKIVGNKKSGYYYVDVSGIRVTDQATQYAVKFVLKHSDSGQSSKERLKSCYEALCHYSYQRFYSHDASADKVKSYALYMFKNKRGNCYRYASALAYIARVLGFDSRVAVGGVTAYANNDLSPHGWCEVKVDGKWKICDCSMQRAHKNNNLFLVEMKNYPFRIRCDTIFTMKIKKGKISWRKK